MENETHYGDFTEYKEPQVSKRSPAVALAAIERCEQLMEELNWAMVRIRELEKEIEAQNEYIENLEYIKREYDNDIKVRESKISG